jgi:hypothetical protein
MSKIRMFRVNGNDICRNTEFYFKVENDSRHVICDLCVADDGIHYFRDGSQILSPEENERTRSTPDFFVRMEDLEVLFEKLMQIKEHGGGVELGFKRGGELIIENT